MKSKRSQRRCWVLGGLALALLAVGEWGQAQAPDLKAAPIRLTVYVPTADAVLTINDAPTKQKGLKRFFQSDPFPTNKRGTYVLKVTWTDKGGEEKEATEKVRVRGGDDKVVKFIKDADDKDNKKKGKKGKEDMEKEPGEGDKDKGDGDKGKDKGSKDGDKGPPDKGAAAPRQREFLFTYAARVKGLEPGQLARIWLPVPPSDETQRVEVVSEKVPGKVQRTTEPKLNNKMLYTEAKADAQGTIPISVTYRVKRQEVRGKLQGSAVTPEEAALFLKPEAKVPVGGKPAATLLKGKDLPRDSLGLARALYDIVNGHMEYKKVGTGWGQGDAVWACDSGYGNCTDFHSLFISLARTKKIPARFEIGFAVPEERGKGTIGGYHCWAEFSPDGKTWVPVDISQANVAKDAGKANYFFGNLTEDRVTFTVGRDLTLAPAQSGPPLNFFIYPYVEVGGKPYAQDKIERSFSYQDV
jgi:uncharacterized protein (TIGR03000 family)